MAGDDLFFEQEFDTVRDGLENAPGADAIGTETVLRPRRDFSLGEDQISARPLQSAHDGGDQDDRDPEAETEFHECPPSSRLRLSPPSYSEECHIRPSLPRPGEQNRALRRPVPYAVSGHAPGRGAPANRGTPAHRCGIRR